MCDTDKMVEVTYCKDCIFYKVPDNKRYYKNPLCCLSALAKREECDYCSKAKPKEQKG